MLREQLSWCLDDEDDGKTSQLRLVDTAGVKTKKWKICLHSCRINQSTRFVLQSISFGLFQCYLQL